MEDDLEPRGSSRARWLAELSAALDDAQLLLSQLAAEKISPAKVDRLRARVKLLRSELRALHRRGFAAGQSAEAPLRLPARRRPRRD